MSLYLDASGLLKVLFPEPETSRVMQLIAAEEHVVVSTLARLETLVQVHARAAGGLLTRPAARSLIDRLEKLLRQARYEVVRADGRRRRGRRAGPDAPARRLLSDAGPSHLAVMKSLDLRRLLTNDDAQARAARALGFSVVVPR